MSREGSSSGAHRPSKIGPRLLAHGEAKDLKMRRTVLSQRVRVAVMFNGKQGIVSSSGCNSPRTYTNETQAPVTLATEWPIHSCIALG